MCRSSHLGKFCKKGVLRNFANFIGKHLCQSFLIKMQAQACNFIKKETLARVFSCEVCKISKNIYFHRTPLVTVSIFPRCYVAKQFLEITYFTDILSLEKFSKNLHGNLKLIFLFSTLFVHFKIGYRQSLYYSTQNFFLLFMNLTLQSLYIAMFFIHQH